MLDDETTGTAVFIVGAGCSADCGSPTMAQFIPRAREYQDDAGPLSADYRALFDFRRKSFPISRVLDRTWDNIEDLFTQIHLRELIGTSQASKLAKAAARVLWDVYRRAATSSAVGYSDFASYLYHLVRQWRGGGKLRPIVMTTNYDVHAETFMVRRKLGVVYLGQMEMDVKGSPYPLVALDEFEKYSEATGANLPIEVVKLHGSINWFKKGKEIECHNQYRNDPTANTPGVPVLYCQDRWDSDRGDPVIVPPLLGKLSNEPVIARQWRQAVQAISCAHVIFILGYSFPETDPFMLRLLAEGFRSNDRINQIYICNNDPSEAWRSRVQNEFARSWFVSKVQWFPMTFADFASAIGAEYVEFPVKPDRQSLVRLNELRALAGVPKRLSSR